MPADPLYPYQRDGARFLAQHPRAYLGDEPGLGKTIQAITACDYVEAERVVVVCPAIARANWRREFARWGVFKRTLEVESYDRVMARLDVRAVLEALSPDVLILDEAHYLKTPTAKRTRAVLGQAHRPGMIGSARRIWCLSGTPAPNNVLELYPPLRFIWPELLPDGVDSFGAFRRHFTHSIETQYGWKVVGNRREAEMRTILSQMFLRRLTKDVLPDLPGLRWGSVAVPRPDLSQYSELAELEREHGAAMLSLVEGEARGVASPHVARMRRLIGEAKAVPAARMIAVELYDEPEKKVIVFAHHRSVLDTLAAELRLYEPAVIHGGTPDAFRNADIERFQTDPKCRVFIGQIQAAGTAITLTAAHDVVIVEPSWTPSDNTQAAGRARRIGQTQPVLARFVALSDSLDDDITRVIERKTRLLTPILEPETV